MATIYFAAKAAVEYANAATARQAYAAWLMYFHQSSGLTRVQRKILVRKAKRLAANTGVPAPVFPIIPPRALT